VEKEGKTISAKAKNFEDTVKEPTKTIELGNCLNEKRKCCPWLRLNL
jgi:hypothetical protein